MDSKKQADDGGRAQVLAEHREIAQLIARITKTEDRKELAQWLPRLATLLERHFTAEESELDGLHADIRERSPEQQNALLGLREEHHEMLRRMRDLCTEVDSEGLRMAQLHEHCLELRARLEAHETKETGLFLDSIWQDIGECD